jgi:predicted MFS family arabinose efflux permease
VFRLLLLISFIESFATILFERGVYFFAHDVLRFSDAANLWLALVFGCTYVAGALVSHALTRRARERTVVFAALGGQIVMNLLLARWPNGLCTFIGSAVLGGLNGITWPVIESYVSAGLSPGQTARRIGAFNVAWSLSVPISIGVVGPILAVRAVGVFWLAAAINVATVLLALRLPPRPDYLEQPHPEALDRADLRRCNGLMVSSRWLLLLGYSTMWILATLFPRIFDDLGYQVAGTALSGVLDVIRMGAFIVLQVWVAWHGRRWPIVVGMIGLPIGFLLAVSGVNLPVVLAGEVVFGLSIGVVYYAAIYYAMLVKNASVAAGGGHEGLIGLGFAVGPLAGLGGVALYACGAVGSPFWGTMLGALPVVLLCLTGALRALAKTAPGRSE